MPLKSTPPLSRKTDKANIREGKVVVVKETYAARERVLAQGLIEKAFPNGPEPCTERVRFAKADNGCEPRDGGFAMKRGLLTGALAEHELQQYAASGALSIDLGSVVNGLTSSRRLNLGPSRWAPELRAYAIEKVRAWQSTFPPDGDELEWHSDWASLSKPQTDYFLRREGKFIIRVRPDNVVGVGSALVAWEWSTAKDPTSISAARYALNHHALLRERLRRPEWERYTTIETRVEMLALQYGYTVRLGPEEAEEWRVAIGRVAEAVVLGQYEINPGAYCSTCPWQLPCRFDRDQPESGEF
jgi:hypothetical protein